MFGSGRLDKILESIRIPMYQWEWGSAPEKTVAREPYLSANVVYVDEDGIERAALIVRVDQGSVCVAVFWDHFRDILDGAPEIAFVDQVEYRATPIKGKDSWHWPQP